MSPRTSRSSRRAPGRTAEAAAVVGGAGAWRWCRTRALDEQVPARLHSRGARGDRRRGVPMPGARRGGGRSPRAGGVRERERLRALSISVDDGVIVADIVAIAAGFVLRAAAGGIAAHVPPSARYLVVASCGAIFIVAGKRHAELLSLARTELTRATLRHYSVTVLRAILAAAATSASVAYSAWAFGRPEHGPWYEISIVPVVLWLCRYGVLVRRGAGESPEELVLRDWRLFALTAMWTALFVGGTYVSR